MDSEHVTGLDDGKRRRAAWIAALWVCFIYLTIPLVRTFQRWFAERFDKIWITVAVLVTMVLILLAVGVWLGRASRRFNLWDIVVLLAVTGVAGLWAWDLRARPEEAIHLLEYGVLVVLIFRAIRPERPDVAVLASAFLLTTFMSTLDEIIQWIIPLRYFDYRDVAINAGAALLAAVAIRRLDPGPWQRPPTPSIQLALRLTVAQLMLLTLCLANTPERVAWYADRVPFLSFLHDADNEMAEYGHLHEAPGGGTFKSRWLLDRLVEEDRLRGAEIAPILDQYPDAIYNDFVHDHRGFQDPLLYEARGHIRSRDYHLQMAREAADNPAMARRHLTVAAREYQILERYFPRSLRASVFVLPQAKRERLMEANDPQQGFRSKSGSHLITFLSEFEIRSILLLFAVSLIATDVTAGVRHRRRKRETVG